MRMSTSVPALVLLAGLAVIQQSATQLAMAQGAVSYNGARPGREPGVGESLPRSENASNIGPGTARALAPSLPRPAVGDGAGPVDLVRVARDALTAGRTGLAQESMEMAETRMLDRVVDGDVIAPSSEAAVMQLRRARQALDAGKRADAIALLNTMLPN